jgi:indolepyruvate ferredoxin oxidoreductase
MMGYAYQKGWLPLGRAALLRAIELNGTQIPNNLAAFAWGRRVAAEPAVVHAMIAAAKAARLGAATPARAT